MNYAVTVNARRPEGAPELDPLQRAGVVHLLREGLDAIEFIEDEGREVAEITDHFRRSPRGRPAEGLRRRLDAGGRRGRAR
ncbi:hypothetical protein [Streptomyces violaceusniger]|uniref:hypothetical protein n=1 Tax=Streptomyces violaceusniger TaxID=68280 RepID=UPI0037F508AE